jgi:hypothetical protein
MGWVNRVPTYIEFDKTLFCLPFIESSHKIHRSFLFIFLTKQKEKIEKMDNFEEYRYNT